MSILEMHNLAKEFGGLSALRDLSFSITAGTISALIGANGAGKTTTFNIICRLLDPTRGRILYQGQSLLERRPHELAWLGVSRTFQIPQIWTGMTVLETVLVGSHPRFTNSLLLVGCGFASSRREEELVERSARHWLNFVGIEDLGAYPVRHLSVGKIRLLELARALAANPQLILMDEPASGLTPAETESLAQLLFKIRNELKKTVLLIEHNMRFVMSIADFIVVLDYGQKIAEGSPQDIRSDRRVQDAYFGRGLVHA